MARKALTPQPQPLSPPTKRSLGLPRSAPPVGVPVSVAARVRMTESKGL